MTVLLWNTGERRHSGLWSPLRTPLFSYNPRPQLVASSALSAGLSTPPPRFCLFFPTTFAADHLINHPGSTIPESRKKKLPLRELPLPWSTRLCILGCLGCDFLWTLARVSLGRTLEKQDSSGLRVRMHFQIVGKGINKLVSLVNSESHPRIPTYKLLIYIMYSIRGTLPGVMLYSTSKTHICQAMLVSILFLGCFSDCTQDTEKWCTLLLYSWHFWIVFLKVDL